MFRVSLRPLLSRFWQFKMWEEIKRVLIHIRWPLQSFTVLGFLFAITISRTNLSIDLAMGFFSWFLLCAGITVFNSYYDKDTGPVAGLINPPSTSFSMLVGAWTLKLSGLFIALFLNEVFLITYVTGIILSVLYSHEKFRLKSNGYIAVLFNFIIGAMAFCVGASFSPIHWRTLSYGAIGAGMFLAAIYLMMQVHQKEQDMFRKDFSIMVIHGRRVTLISSILIMLFAAIFCLASFVSAGYQSAYIVGICAYFLAIFVSSYLWFKRRATSTSDFKIMNRLTTRISYAANIIIILIYFFEVLMKG